MLDKVPDVSFLMLQVVSSGKLNMLSWPNAQPTQVGKAFRFRDSFYTVFTGKL